VKLIFPIIGVSTLKLKGAKKISSNDLTNTRLITNGGKKSFYYENAKFYQ